MEKQKYKIIFIDIDGTLVNDEKQVSQRTINTIKKLKEKGIITVLTSGRPYGSIEKYSIQNAISYDYFGSKWTPFSEILKKMPLQVEDPAAFVASHRFYEVSDSTRHYFLRIESFKKAGDTEPFELAKTKISNLILNKLKAEFISNFDDEIYKDAIENENVTYFKK